MLQFSNSLTGIMSASTIVLAVVLPLNVALNIVLVHHTSLRLFGAPLALSITYWTMFVLLLVFVKFSPSHKRNGTWGGFDLAAIIDPKSSWAFMKLALPGIVMVGTEW